MASQGRVDLDPREAEEAEERALPTPQVVFETIRKEGEQELVRSSAELLWSGLAAGAVDRVLPDRDRRVAHLPSKRAVAAAGRGFRLQRRLSVVVLGRQQLFTENTLTPVLPILTAFDVQALRSLARLWALVLTANLAGCALIALALATAPAG